MKGTFVVCLENGDVIESDEKEGSVEELAQTVGVIKHIKDLSHFSIPKDGNTIFINPNKIMWIETRFSE